MRVRAASRPAPPSAPLGVLLAAGLALACPRRPAAEAPRPAGTIPAPGSAPGASDARGGASSSGGLPPHDDESERHEELPTKVRLSPEVVRDAGIQTARARLDSLPICRDTNGSGHQLPVRTDIKDLLSVCAPARMNASAYRYLPFPGRLRKSLDVDLALSSLIGCVCDPLSIRRELPFAFRKLRLHYREWLSVIGQRHSP